MIWLLSASLAMLMAMQWFLVWRFSTYLATKDGRDTSSFRPRVAIILCARGADPHLAACLTMLSRQDWPDYQVFFVTDHAQDPAVAVFRTVLKTLNSDRFEHWIATDRNPDCSLKCNSLVWACERLHPRFEVVALIDADVVTDERWLQRLVAPLSKPRVAASYGMRWFEPSSQRMGSHVRAMWNAAAIVQMQAYNIAWGGSLAIRRLALEQSGLLARWRSTLFEDVMVAPHLARLRLATQMCPDLVLINREDATLANVSRWMTRQLLDVKLYHPHWTLVLLHAIGTGAVLVAGLTFSIVYLILGHFVYAALCLLLLLLSQGLNVALLKRIKKAVRSAARPFRGSAPLPKSQRFLLACTALPLCQVHHLLAIFRAAAKSQVAWRGLEYEIRADQTVRLRKYIPMNDVVSANSGKDSASESID